MGTLTPLINQYLAARRARGEISANTACDYRWTLRGLDDSYGNRPLRMFGPGAVDDWLGSIGHLSDATRRQYASKVRGFTQWMVLTGKLRVDPTLHLKPIHQARKAVRTLTPVQVGTLLGVLPDRRARAIVWLMVGCGFRCTSVARLRVEDYDPVRRLVTVTNKGGGEDVVPVPREVAAALDAYLDETGCVAGAFVRSHRDPTRGLSARTLSGYVRAWMRLAGVKVRAHDGRSAHALRRTAASDVLDRGGDVRVVQAMLCHQRLETTARYLRPVPLEAMRDAMEGRSYAA